ncbi:MULTISPECIES: Fur-regulated basic protein FbpA [Bacillaceae]|uniref:Fur-regulated basic protein FbpA n=1 Tax=Ectobacillus funiculus TaxID=137993 RepID=A0ABV5WLV8_9BACI|nr:Fur-regulated basic protein FbpA [Ectobacillus funiculus]
MSNLLRKAVERQKRFYIERLLEAGIYKKSNVHLYEMTLSDLKQVYQSYRHSQQHL